MVSQSHQLKRFGARSKLDNDTDDHNIDDHKACINDDNKNYDKSARSSIELADIDIDDLKDRIHQAQDFHGQTQASHPYHNYFAPTSRTSTFLTFISQVFQHPFHGLFIILFCISTLIFTTMLCTHWYNAYMYTKSIQHVNVVGMKRFGNLIIEPEVFNMSINKSTTADMLMHDFPRGGGIAGVIDGGGGGFERPASVYILPDGFQRKHVLELMTQRVTQAYEDGEEFLQQVVGVNLLPGGEKILHRVMNYQSLKDVEGVQVLVLTDGKGSVVVDIEMDDNGLFKKVKRHWHIEEEERQKLRQRRIGDRK